MLGRVEARGVMGYVGLRMRTHFMYTYQAAWPGSARERQPKRSRWEIGIPQRGRNTQREHGGKRCYGTMRVNSAGDQKGNPANFHTGRNRRKS